MEIEGVVPPVITPVDGREGTPNADALYTHTRTLLDGGVHGLFPCGTTGEFASLTRETRRTVIETVVQAAGEAPVLAGCGHTSVRCVRKLIDDAADVGADAAVVVTPYYLSTTQTGLCEFYERLADDSSLPIVLYDIPTLTDQRLEPASVVRLADHENVVGVKDSGGDLRHFYQLVRRTPDDFAVLQGSTACALPSLDVGADGFVSGGANAFPGVLAEVYDAWTAGDRDRAASLVDEAVFPIVEAITTMPGIPAIKYLTLLSGNDVGPPVVPLPELTDEQKEWLEERYWSIVDTVE